MPWLLLRRVAVAVRNCYQVGGDAVKSKIGRGECWWSRRLEGCEWQFKLNDKTKLCPREEMSIFFLSVRGLYRETSATADAVATPIAQVVIIVVVDSSSVAVVVVAVMIECDDRQQQ